MRRKKMRMSDLCFSRFDFGWYADGRATRKDGIRGWFFKFDHLTKEQEDFILGWKNTELAKCSPMYAPEIVNRVVFMWDKCIR